MSNDRSLLRQVWAIANVGRNKRAILEQLEPRISLSGVTKAQVIWHSTTKAPTKIWGSEAVAIGNDAVFANKLVYHGQNGTWVQDSTSSTHFDSSAVAVGGKALFAGGWRSGTYRSSGIVDIYDVATEAWSQATLTQPRNFIAAVSVGGYALFAGGDIDPVGDGPGTPSDVVDIYNSRSNTWSTARLSHNRVQAVASVGDEAIFYYQGSADIFNATTSAWSTVTVPDDLYAPAAAVVDGRALFAGGFPQHRTSSTAFVSIYDSRTHKWSTGSLSVGRSNIGAANVRDQAVFAGGFKDSVGVNNVDIYDALHNRWSMAVLSQSRTNPVPAVLEGTVFFAGGAPIGDGAVDDSHTTVVDVYNSKTGLWTHSVLANPRRTPDALNLGDKVLFAGDRENTAHLDVADIYQITSIQIATGRGVDGTLKVALANTNGLDIPAGYKVSVFIATTASDRGATMVGSATLTSPLAAGQSRQFDFHISRSGRLIQGHSHLIIELTPGGRGHGQFLASEARSLGTLSERVLQPRFRL